MFESSLRCCRLASRCVAVCFRFISVTVWILWGEGEKQVWFGGGGGEVRRGVQAPAEDACHSCWCLCRPRRRKFGWATTFRNHVVCGASPTVAAEAPPDPPP